ncbi:hypothetical protein ABZ490_32465 [Streptomyces sp. NPDC005811]|uniref:hypothetical protein n=1 Tax=Streptomyces sp. NPDC005811 TaxID=3154565 RepID=UPI0033D4EC41
MSRITSLPDGDTATFGAVDDLVITEFGHDPAEIPDGRICICWIPSHGPASATDGGRTSR